MRETNAWPVNGKNLLRCPTGYCNRYAYYFLLGKRLSALRLSP